MAAHIYTSNSNVAKQTNRAWQIFLVIFVAIAIPLSLVALKLALDFRSKAGEDPLPDEVVVSNITDTSVTISFMTKAAPAQTSIKYSLNGGSEQQSFFDTRSQNGTETFSLHNHKLTNLTPDTQYTFKIIVGTTEFPNTNAEFTNQFKTFPTSDDVPTPKPINGKVNASIFKDGVIYAHLTNGTENSSVISSIIPESNGAYSLDLGGAKTKTGDVFDLQNAKIVLFASIANQGRGYVSADPTEQFMPEITLTTSQANYDPDKLDYVAEFTTGTPTATATPSQTITITPMPIETLTPTVTNTPVSTPVITSVVTNTPVPTSTPSTSVNLKITNIQNSSRVLQGATILGQGPLNGEVKLTIGTAPATTVRTNSTGSWQYTLPENIAVGNTTIKAESGGSVVNLNIKIEKLGDLPQTAISDYTVHIVALSIFGIGLYMLNWVRKNKQWETGI